MTRQRTRTNTLGGILAATGLGLAALAAGPAAAAQAAPTASAPLVAAPSETPSHAVQQVVGWVLATGDNRGLPFLVVDKQSTAVFVFDGRGKRLGDTQALLGSARGDDSAPGIGDRKLQDIRPEERTTPAGRFVASLGHSLGKDDVLWVDYRLALALHRVLAVNSREHRLQRLSSVSPLDHRITFGCINVPARFYDQVVQPAFTGTNGIVYILPEIKSVSAVFFSASAQAANAPASHLS